MVLSSLQLLKLSALCFLIVGILMLIWCYHESQTTWTEPLSESPFYIRTATLRKDTDIQPIPTFLVAPTRFYGIRNVSVIDALKAFPVPIIGLDQLTDNSTVSQRWGNLNAKSCLLMADGRPAWNFRDPLPPVSFNGWEMSFNRLTPIVNGMYALRHGYQLWFFQLPDDLIRNGERDATWYKVPLTHYLLQHHCDRVFWLDTDAFVYDQPYSLDQLQLDFQLDAVEGPWMVLPKDCCTGDRGPNLGSYLILNSSRSLSFVEAWWRLPYTDPRMKDKFRQGQHEQEGIRVGMDKEYGTFWTMTPMSFMTTPDGKFVRHFWAQFKSADAIWRYAFNLAHTLMSNMETMMQLMNGTTEV